MPSFGTLGVNFVLIIEPQGIRLDLVLLLLVKHSQTVEYYEDVLHEALLHGHHHLEARQRAGAAVFFRNNQFSHQL